MKVTVTGGELSQQEIDAYKARASKKYPDAVVEKLEIHLDGDYADLYYTIKERPFQRIRRITGYLVGTTDRWNDAKQAEEKDRVKHI